MPVNNTLRIAINNQISTSTMPSLHAPLSHYKTRIRLTLSLLLLTACLIYFPILPSSTKHAELHTLPLNAPQFQQSSPRIAKATILYPRSNALYSRALALHEAQNARLGYEMYILHSRIVKGALNKLLWIQQLLVKELQKHVEEQVEWILYFDPSIILWNEHIPLHIFLPPVTDYETFKALSIIATKPDEEQISTAVFFMKVSAVSLRILVLAMAEVMGTPGRDDGVDVLATALQSVLEREGNRDKVIYQPADWYNTTEERKGTIFRQLGSPSHVQRLLDMEHALWGLEHEKKSGDGDTGLDQHPSTDDVDKFWSSVTEARRVLNVVTDWGHRAEMEEWEDVVRDVRDYVDFWAWDTDEMMRKVDMLKEGLGME